MNRASRMSCLLLAAWICATCQAAGLGDAQLKAQNHAKAWDALLREVSLRERKARVTPTDLEKVSMLAQVAVAGHPASSSSKASFEHLDQAITWLEAILEDLHRDGHSADALPESLAVLLTGGPNSEATGKTKAVSVGDSSRGQFAQREGYFQVKFLLGRLYSYAGNLREAYRHLADCLKYWEPEAPRAASKVARVLNNLGAVEAAWGRCREARQHFEQAAKLVQERLSKKSDLNATEEAELLARKAEACEGLGNVLGALGNYSGGVQRLLEAIDQWRELARNEAWRLEAERRWYLANANLATIYRSQGRRKEAIGLLRPLVAELKQRYGADTVYLRECYNALADCYIGDGQSAPAKTYAACALTSSANDVQGLVARHHLATIAFSTGDLRGAQQQWEALLQEHRKRDHPLWKGRTLRGLGDVAYKRGQWETAAKHYQEATDILDSRGALPVARFNAWFGLGLAQHDLGRMSAAADSLKKAIEVIEFAGATAAGGDIHREQYSGQFRAAYDALIKCLLAQGETGQALFCAEMVRNRTFGDELALAGGDWLSTVPRKDKQRYEGLLRDRAELLWQMRSPKPPGDARKRLEELESAISGLWYELRGQSPTYRQLLGTPLRDGDWKRGAEQLSMQLEWLTSQGNMLLYYYLGTTDGYVWVITRGGIRHYHLEIASGDAEQPGGGPLPLNRARAAELVNGYLTKYVPPRQGRTRSYGIEAPGPPPPPSRDKLTPREQKELMGVTEAVLPTFIRDEMKQGIRHVTIIPDAALHRLPFPALTIGVAGNGEAAKSQYLIDDAAIPPISYAPSIRVLLQLHKRLYLQKARNCVLTVGGTNEKELPFSRKECEEVARLYPEQVIRPLLVGRRARERLIELYTPGCRILHFADHARYDPRHDNLFGYVTLYQGRLELHRVYGLDLLGCEAVVLSACETNVSRDRGLETGNSLARAFLAAGAARVVSSFWGVDDKATFRLMSAFFQELAEAERAGQPPDYALALRTAMRRVRAEGFDAPGSWAPFALIGPAELRPGPPETSWQARH